MNDRANPPVSCAFTAIMGATMLPYGMVAGVLQHFTSLQNLD